MSYMCQSLFSHYVNWWNLNSLSLKVHIWQRLSKKFLIRAWRGEPICEDSKLNPWLEGICTLRVCLYVFLEAIKFSHVMENLLKMSYLQESCILIIEGLLFRSLKCVRSHAHYRPCAYALSLGFCGDFPILVAFRVHVD